MSAIASLLLRSQIATRPGGQPPDKPMEDRAFADDRLGLYGVCDGVTRSAAAGRYPNPSPAAQAAERFVQHAVACLAAAGKADPRAALRAAAEAGNRAVGALNAAGRTDYFENDLAGTVAVLALVRDAVLHFAFVGDCALHLVRCDRLQRVTRSQTAAVGAWRRGRPQGAATTVALRRELRNRPGAAAAFGCFTGEPAALQFLEQGAVGLQPGDRILLSSDGMDPAFEAVQALDAAARDAALRADAAQWMERALQAEAQRGLVPDDKALVLVEFAADDAAGGG